MPCNQDVMMHYTSTGKAHSELPAIPAPGHSLLLPQLLQSNYFWGYVILVQKNYSTLTTQVSTAILEGSILFNPFMNGQQLGGQEKGAPE